MILKHFQIFLKANLLMVGLLVFLNSCQSQQETAQWRGPDRSGHYPDADLLQVWPEEGLPVLAEFSDLGTGHSSLVLFDDKIYTTGRKDTLEYLSCFTPSGELLWQQPFGNAWYKSYPDTRTTPTIEDNRVYLISGSGEVACHDAATGDQIWMVDADSLYSGEIWVYGVSESPLLTEKAVIYTTGGERYSLIALDKQSGELIWTTPKLGGARGYASHILVNHNDIPMIIAQTAVHAFGVHAQTGELLWEHDLFQYHEIRMGKGNNINTPIYQNGKVFITSGYDHPGILFEIDPDGRSVDIIWMNKEIDVHLGGAILHGGYLYASNWQNNRMGRWVCVDWDTGELQWEEEWYNKGSIIMADGLGYIYEEKSGHIGLLNPNPEKFDLISSFRMEKGKGPYWAHPAIYNGILYLRHGDIALSYELKKSK